MKPLVSIVTPCYNSQAFVGATIESVRGQSVDYWEHVVVDDGSKDASASVVEGFLGADSKLRLVKQANGGVCKARNAGYKATTPGTKYLLFLDADDVMEPHMLATLTDYLEAHPDVVLVHCGHSYIDPEGKPLDEATARVGWRERFVPAGLGLRPLRDDEPETPFCSILALAGLVPSLSLIRRDAFEASGGFDEEFGQHYEETDLFLRLALQGKIHYLPEKLLRHRRHPDQSTAHTEKFARQEKKLYTKWQNPAGLTPKQQAIVDEGQWFLERRFAPIMRFRAATRQLKERKIKSALGAYLGAFKRYIGVGVRDGSYFPDFPGKRKQVTG